MGSGVKGVRLRFYGLKLRMQGLQFGVPGFAFLVKSCVLSVEC